MSIEEKLLTVAAGLEEINEGINLEAELINELQSIVDNMPTDSNGSYEAGKQAQEDAFWDAIQENGKRMHYSYAFAFLGWNDEIYNPKYPIVPTHTNGIAQLFQWNQWITDTKVPITAYGNCQGAFYQTVIKRIPKLIFTPEATNTGNMFQYNTVLEECYCEGELCGTVNLGAATKLNKASIESIIDVLSDTTSGLSITLSKTAVDNAFYDPDGEDVIGSTSSAWTWLCDSKSNWTINLV